MVKLVEIVEKFMSVEVHVGFTGELYIQVFGHLNVKNVETLLQGRTVMIVT